MDIDLTKFDFVGDRLLVQPVKTNKAKTVTVDGVEKELAQPEEYDAKPEMGTVISHGEGRLLENGELVKMPCSAGDVVFFGKYSADKVRYLGTDYLVIRQDDIIAVRPS